ncbi:MAG: BON domain-containing protein [Candidatus Parcubacteria bacterium]|nr:BON domain-containing protein [Burkholderiales bacterium]
MKKIRIRSTLSLLVLSALAVSLQGCIEIAAMGVGAALVSTVDRRTTGAQVDDEGIELRTTNRASERFGDRVHLNVTSYNRSVLLTGEVPDEKAKAEIEKIAAGIPNVRNVTNDLRVAAGTTLGARANDTAITGKVKARFVDANRFNALLVKVVTENATVYLMGIVTEAEANSAVETARTTSGVRKVVKLFDYCKPTEAMCAPPKPTAEEPKKSGT